MDLEAAEHTLLKEYFDPSPTGRRHLHYFHVHRQVVAFFAFSKQAISRLRRDAIVCKQTNESSRVRAQTKELRLENARTLPQIQTTVSITARKLGDPIFRRQCGCTCEYILPLRWSKQKAKINIKLYIWESLPDVSHKYQAILVSRSEFCLPAQ